MSNAPAAADGSDSPRPRLLAVDHNRRNLELLAQFIAQAGYEFCAAANAEEFRAALDGPEPVALALIDLAGFDRGVWDLCERVRSLNIPFLVISARQSAAIEAESLAHGAHSLLIKPLIVRELLALIQRLLEE